ncbi:MAG: UDP-glucose 4-epimerase GalE [Candidatus Omnitrophica bacterium]|nr:UDP-glucose 4-epimerase GalE [Candidatus Omnitrophota bacterium]
MSETNSLGSRVLLIGGAGYVGSHMLRNLLTCGITPIVFDNLSSGFRRFIPKGVPFVKGDLRQLADIRKVLKKFKIDCILHFASAIVVSESVSDPGRYYENNVLSFINLIQAMREADVQQMIFSSSAAVYAAPKKLPIAEDALLGPNTAYGHSKLMCEQILRDVAAAHKDFSFVVFRYFNVAGAYDQGGIGENHDPETHLIPLILKAALGEKKSVQVFGDDYPTVDGTCIRDFIHVDDVCDAHFLALKNLTKSARNQTFNLGNQKGFSVKQVIDAVKKVTGQDFKVQICPPRAGDNPKLIADFCKAKEILGWKPQRSLEKMIASAWAWEKNRKAGLLA